MAIDEKTREREPIRRDAAYTVAQFFHATGISRSGLRQHERRGLRTVRVGGRKYVRGEDWHEYLVGAGSTSAQQDNVTNERP